MLLVFTMVFTVRFNLCDARLKQLLNFVPQANSRNHVQSDSSQLDNSKIFNGFVCSERNLIRKAHSLRVIAPYYRTVLIKQWWRKFWVGKCLIISWFLIFDEDSIDEYSQNAPPRFQIFTRNIVGAQDIEQETAEVLIKGDFM